jgi:hypothetical protein
MKNDIGLPKIYVEKDKIGYSLHWDYQPNESNKILLKRMEYLNGYIDCAIATTADAKSRIVCANSQTGTIRNLTKESAEKLEKILTDLLHPIVQREHERIIKRNNLPHIIFQNEQDGA